MLPCSGDSDSTIRVVELWITMDTRKAKTELIPEGLDARDERLPRSWGGYTAASAHGLDCPVVS